jgi:7,8-dihydropterin-6-yl-methyl-4-(beta-D-ribofuranosyl)aminobenzene 5'-phosphate synthase
MQVSLAMPDLMIADRLDVLVLVDNVTDSLSTNPTNVIPEWSGLLAAGRLQMMSGRNICCAHHGLSLLITAHIGSERRSLLFDTGPEGATFLRNAAILGVDLSTIDAVVLSHGHWDHAGGLPAAIETIAKRRTEKGVDCFVHPGMFAQRGSQRPNGEFYLHEPVPDPKALTKAGANVINTREPQSAVGGAFYISGEIPRLTKYEVGLPGHVRRSADGESWEPDPLIMDERFVSVLVKDKGQFVFSACSHAGVINVLTHARSKFPTIPLHGVMGGLHLSGVTEKIIPETIADLKQFSLKLIAPGHCTGWRALSAMAKVFGDELIPSAVGKRYLI